MSRIKKCLHCAQPFLGRRDAKTCSAACRKAMQRKRQALAVEQGQPALGAYTHPDARQLPNINADFSGLAGQRA